MRNDTRIGRAPLKSRESSTGGGVDDGRGLRLTFLRREDRYRNDYFGDLEVVAKGKALTLRMGPKMAEFPMRHWDRDVFTYQPVGENAGGSSGITFLVGPGRNATRMVVENLDIQGQGTFSHLPPKK